MRKSLNLFKGQKQHKNAKTPYRSLPIRRVGKMPKQTSKERYYKDKGVDMFNEEMDNVYLQVSRKKYNIG